MDFRSSRSPQRRKSFSRRTARAWGDWWRLGGGLGQDLKGGGLRREMGIGLTLVRLA